MDMNNEAEICSLSSSAYSLSPFDNFLSVSFEFLPVFYDRDFNKIIFRT